MRLGGSAAGPSAAASALARVLSATNTCGRRRASAREWEAARGRPGVTAAPKAPSPTHKRAWSTSSSSTTEGASARAALKTWAREAGRQGDGEAAQGGHIPQHTAPRCSCDSLRLEPPPPALTMCTSVVTALPGYLPASAAGLRSKRTAPAWCATAPASRLLPAPGGPYSSTVRGACSLQVGREGRGDQWAYGLARWPCEFISAGPTHVLQQLTHLASAACAPSGRMHEATTACRACASDGPG